MNTNENRVDLGSPVSVGTELVPSDVESGWSLEDNKGYSINSPPTHSTAEATLAPVVPTPAPDDVMLPVHPEFAYRDGNVELQTPDYIFWVHEFLLKKFSILAEQIEKAKEKDTMSNARRVKIKTSRHSDNIVAAFRVLYAPVFPGPEAHKFNSETLIKALRIATLYECPDMRTYAISELETRFAFLPIHRIQMSDEFNLPHWEKPAFIELCRRPEPISKEEAKILGFDRLTEISRIREAEQRRKFVEFVDKSVESHGSLHQGPVMDDQLRASARYTLKYSSLPKCDCNSGDLKIAVSNQVPRGDRRDFSVEDEISRATWVRKVN
ncbi:hypothetical protein OPQ81_010285 [Rhizoctonia solani]|nr:hypothetical protein OPQ81_010285 [Rhizoctonia solani]